MIEPGFGAIVHLKHLLDPSELTRLVARCHPCSCSKRPQGDRRIGIVHPIGLRPQLGQNCPLVIGAHEFRPGQRNDDVVALQFDVEFVIVHHQADTNASALGHGGIETEVAELVCRPAVASAVMKCLSGLEHSDLRRLDNRRTLTLKGRSWC